MATLEDVEKVVSSLPEVTVGQRYGNRTWFVSGKGFCWERPFSKADIRRFGSTPPPSGPIVATLVADLHEKEAVLASGVKGLFDMAHFDGYPAILIQLDVVTKKGLSDAIVDGWLAAAPAALADTYMKAKRRR